MVAPRETLYTIEKAILRINNKITPVGITLAFINTNAVATIEYNAARTALITINPPKKDLTISQIFLILYRVKTLNNLAYYFKFYSFYYLYYFLIKNGLVF